jgi:hypothetical protein
MEPDCDGKVGSFETNPRPGKYRDLLIFDQRHLPFKRGKRDRIWMTIGVDC